MRAHVRRDGRTLREFATANIARERFLAGVSPKVSGEIRCLSKCFRAFVTFVRLENESLGEDRMDADRLPSLLNEYADVFLRCSVERRFSRRFDND